MNGNLLAVFCLSLASGLVYLQGQIEDLYAKPKNYDGRVAELELVIERKNFELELRSFQFEQFASEVAAALPGFLKGPDAHSEKKYPIRSLASVVGKPRQAEYELQSAKQIFEKAKTAFSAKNYVQSNRLLEKVVDFYPYAIDLPQAYFLLIEGHFREGNLDTSVQLTKKMMRIFPEHEMTGFALLRLGYVFEMQDRKDEAIEVYQTVLQVFPHRNIASQARSSLQAVEF